MNIKEKLTSRKFLTSLIGVILGIAIAFGLDEGTITTIAGAVVSLVSAVTYIMVEGKIDAAAVNAVVDAAAEVVEEIDK